MSTFTLAISFLTTSNLPCFMDLTFQVPMHYCSLALDLASITSHIHNWVLFLLWLHLFILSGVISPLISSSTLGTYRPGESIRQCHIFLLFHTVYGRARILKWSVTPFCSGPCFVRTLHHDPFVLGGMAHSFTELDKVVVHVIRMVSFLWLWFSVCLPSDGEG